MVGEGLIIKQVVDRARRRLKISRQVPQCRCINQCAATVLFTPGKVFHGNVPVVPSVPGVYVGIERPFADKMVRIGKPLLAL